jgi:hypothetical protein
VDWYLSLELLRENCSRMNLSPTARKKPPTQMNSLKLFKSHLRQWTGISRWKSCVKRTARATALGTGLVEPFPQPTRLSGKGTTSRVAFAVPAGGAPRLIHGSAFLPCLRHVLALTDTIATKRYSRPGCGRPIFPAASSMSDPSKVRQFVLHIDLGYPPFLSRSSLDGPLSPYRTEISTCIRIQSRPRFILYLVLE